MYILSLKTKSYVCFLDEYVNDNCWQKYIHFDEKNIIDIFVDYARKTMI